MNLNESISGIKNRRSAGNYINFLKFKQRNMTPSSTARSIAGLPTRGWEDEISLTGNKKMLKRISSSKGSLRKMLVKGSSLPYSQQTSLLKSKNGSRNIFRQRNNASEAKSIKLKKDFSRK